MAKIIRLARLVEYICRADRSKEEIAQAIKEERNNGTITDDEALELVIEYTTY